MDRSKLNRAFHALLGEMGMSDRKEDVLSGYGVESSRDLSDEQLEDVVDRLRDEKNMRAESRLKTRRSIVLRLLTDLGVYYVAPGEPARACWGRVNAFLESPKIAGKVLFKLDEQELIALERKLRGMKDKGYYYRPQPVDTAPAAPIAQVAAPPKSQVVPIVIHMNADSDPAKVN